MTHDELLEKMRHIGKVEVFYESLRAVVELHKQRGDLCETCFHRYPCVTIQSITEKLSPLSKSQIKRITKVESDELQEKELK